jgi:allantoinase
MPYDLIIRGGTLVMPEGVRKGDVVIGGGQIVEVQDEILEDASDVLDATGLHILPGLLDTHVHFNEPGRTHWEGLASGSAALAAGGGTLFADMPLNSVPPTLNRAGFEAKRHAAEAHSITDFALWGGLTPKNVEAMPELAELGVMGFKAFMSSSGVEEFEAADDLTLYRGMQIAAQLGLPVAVHAESEGITNRLTQELRSSGGWEPRDWCAARPVIAELEAINRAILFAHETGADLHVVHVSSARGVALVQEARAQGVRVTCETCPHYLHFSEEDLERLGTIAKCAPPLRAEEERRALWQVLVQDQIDLVASDHSPSPPDLKEADDFFNVWGGIAGVQSSLAVLVTHASQHGLTLPQIARLTAQAPAERYRLPCKGRLEPGFDADLVLVDLEGSFVLEQNALLYRHAISPYVGERFKGTVRRTLVRGHTVYADGQVERSHRGRLIRPTPPERERTAS